MNQDTQKQSGSGQEGIYCSSCGHFNPAWRSQCEQCQTSLARPGTPVRSYAKSRPGCVTAYAVLLGVGAAIMVVGGLLSGISEGEFLILLVLVILGVLYFLLARGLWLLRNWARIIVIVTHSLGMAGAIISACLALGSGSSGYAYTDPTYSFCSAGISLAISGYIIYWFSSNKDYFD